jgi:hypothetical protein
LLSRHQNARQNRCIKVANISFEQAAQTNHLGRTVTNENLIQEEIKTRLNSGNACCHSAHNLLSSPLRHPGFTSRDLATIMSLQSKIVSLAPPPPKGEGGPVTPHAPVSLFIAYGGGIQARLHTGCVHLPFPVNNNNNGARDTIVVKVASYKPEGSGLETR